MRAAFIEATGGPPESIRVDDLPTPEPGPGEVLVRVGAAALNPIDLYIRSGLVPMPMAFPYVVGCDLAGTVERLGPGAGRFRVGDRVWGSNQGMMGRPGACSQFAAVAEDWLYPTPAVWSDAEAASVALVGITAHLGLFRCARLETDEAVYVSGGGGGVGSMVLQMVKAAGARVATSAGRAETLNVARDLGADLVLDYKADDVPARLREFAPEGIDVWYETQRNPDPEVVVPLLRRRGRLVIMAGRAARPTLPVGAFYTKDCSIYGFAMFNASPDEQRRCANDMIAWAEAGRLRPVVGRVFPLGEVAAAQRLLEDNTLGSAGTLFGKVVIQVA